MSTLMKRLELALIDSNLELKTNTPREILAAYLVECLHSFEKGLIARAHAFSRPTGIENYPYEHQD